MCAHMSPGAEHSIITRPEAERDDTRSRMRDMSAGVIADLFASSAYVGNMTEQYLGRAAHDGDAFSAYADSGGAASA